MDNRNPTLFYNLPKKNLSAEETVQFKNLAENISLLIEHPKQLLSFLELQNSRYLVLEDPSGETLWHKYVNALAGLPFDEDQKEIATFLLKNTANMNSANNSGIRPFHLATKHANLNLLDWLFQRGANVNAQTKSGFSALHFAAAEGLEKVFSFLIYNIGVDIYLRDNYGCHAVERMEKNQALMSKEEQLPKEVVEKIKRDFNGWWDMLEFDYQMGVKDRPTYLYRPGSIEATHTIEMQKYLKSFPFRKDAMGDIFEKYNIPRDVVPEGCYINLQLYKGHYIKHIPNIPVYLNNRLYDYGLLSPQLYIKMDDKTGVMYDPANKQIEVSWKDIRPAYEVREVIEDILRKANPTYGLRP